MKPMSKMTIFLIFLLLSNVLLLNISKDVLKKLRFKEVLSNTNFSSFKQSDDSSDALPSILPNFNNKGFKCVRATPKFEKIAELCAFYDQSCVSNGAILFGPDDKGYYEVIFKEKGESVICNLDKLGLSKDTKIEGKKCYSTEISDKTDVLKDTPIPINYFQHRACVNKASLSKVKFVKQFENISCKIEVFDKDNKESKDCFCFSINMPKIDQSVQPFYFPVRIINNGFQCNKSLGSGCDTYNSRKNCLGSIQGNLNPKKFDKIDSDLSLYTFKYFFNRWICPDESGLDVAVLFQTSEDRKNYKVSCLGRKGEDCFYDENAQQACKRINNCPEAKPEFAAVECGSDSYKSTWDHDGFNTPLNTFCKRANGWLRFDSSISLNDDKKRAVMMIGNGSNSCIADPNKSNECLSENESKLLQKTIEYYEANPSNYNNLLVCNVTNFPESVTDKNHWCVKPLVFPNDKGQFSLDLSSIKV